MNFAVDTAIEPPAFSDAQNARSRAVLAAEINLTWGRGPADIIRCGQLLREARDELGNDAFKVMVKTELAFDASVARKLKLIAANETICAHVHKLPACWSTIYELSQLTVGTLEAAIADGLIHPRMQRKDAIALRPAKPVDKPATAGSVVTTNPTELITVWQAASLEQRRALLDELGMQVFVRRRPLRCWPICGIASSM